MEGDNINTIKQNDTKIEINLENNNTIENIEHKKPQEYSSTKIRIETDLEPDEKNNNIDNEEKKEEEKKEKEIKEKNKKNVDYIEWQKNEQKKTLKHANEINEKEKIRLREQWKKDEENEKKNAYESFCCCAHLQRREVR